MLSLPKLKRGDKVAVVSPSFGAPGKWPHMYALGLSRLRDVFGLEPVEFPATKKIGASGEERASDLVAAFEDRSVKAVIASLGGDDQITYIKNLPPGPFVRNPKPFLGFSDNTHFANFLWLNGIPSFYGASLLPQFAMEKRMDPYTIEFLNHALFDSGEFEIRPSETYNDVGLLWEDPDNMSRERMYEPNEGWAWDGSQDAEGITWGGCLESIDELLRHGATIPALEKFEHIVVITETSQEIPSVEYVHRVYRALGERGILERVRAVLVGRPKAWDFDKQATLEQKRVYRERQRAMIQRAVRQYNRTAPIVQNFDIGHTDPQIAFPYGGRVRILATKKRVYAEF